MLSVKALAAACAVAATVALPTHQLLSGTNIAADHDVWMPFVGLGNGDHSPIVNQSRKEFHTNITAVWLGLGGRRLDGADSYGDERAVATGIARAGFGAAANRSSIFLTSKVGPGGYNFPLGYDDALDQAEGILRNYSTTYMDLLLIHGPKVALPAVVAPRDPLCVPPAGQSQPANLTACRLSTWRAMLQVWRAGKARAVGVSNYGTAELGEIEAAGLPLPAVNQISSNPLAPQGDVLAWCAARGVRVQAYHSFGGYGGGGSVLAHPTIQAIAAAHGRSVAQVVLNYQAASNISVNPGFTGPGIPGYKPMATVRAYMGENLHFFDFALTAADMAAIAAIGK